MPKSSSPMFPLVVAGVAGLCIVGFLIWGASRSPKSNQQSQEDAPAEKVAEPVAPPVVESTLPDGYAMVGGVPRPKSDVGLATTAGNARTPPKKRQGFSPALPPDTNPQVQLVHDALGGERDKPERFSSFVIPRNFDAEAFKAAPAEYAAQYASIVEPGRVFAPAQPGEGVAVIRSQSSRFHRVKQGETVRLQVEAVPNAPVTFTSQDLGQFKNELTSITVVAGDDGLATANFTASGGTIDEVRILAASPITSGQLTFTVSVSVED